MYNHIPEPRLEPDAPPTYTASCGHEVTYGTTAEAFSGEWSGVYEWEGQYICPECLKDKLEELPLIEKARIHGVTFLLLEDVLGR